MRKKTCVILLLVLVALGGGATHGRIVGKLVDSENGEPLPAANIMVENTTHGAATDLDGFYLVDRLPPGEYTITASMIGYADISVTEVSIEQGAVTTLNFSLTPAVIQMTPVVITAERAQSSVAGLLSSQKKAPAISSGISSEQIAKTPDPSASDVLKRVTGLSVVNDKFVFVRGLSERYSNARLNKSTLPSPEPDKVVVPFDIFPANLLDNIIINKAFIPSLPGDFAGGSIQLTTKEFPNNFIARFSTGLGYNSQTTGNDFSTYSGGSYDFLGFDDGTRSLPNMILEQAARTKVVESGQFSDGFTPAEIEAFGESFSNVWSPYTRKAPINQSYSFSIGNKAEFAGRPLGYIASLTYKNKFSRHVEERFYYIFGADSLEARHHYEDFTVNNFHIMWGGILNTSYKFSPDHKIGIRTTYTRTADDEVRTYNMFPNRDHNLDEMCTRLRWVERSLLSSEISGDHRGFPLFSKVGWRVTYSLATRSEPDTREILFESDVGLDSFRLADESNAGSRFFSDLTDHNIDSELNLDIPFKQWASLPSKLEFGGGFVYKDRSISSRRFRFKPTDFHTVDIYQNAEDIFVPENIGPNGFQLVEITRPTDNYNGTHRIAAGYAMVDMPINTKLRFVGGIRYENSRQEVETFDLFNPDADKVLGSVSTHDVLPAANFRYGVNEDMNIRVGFSQTVSRPSFRELSNFEFTDIGGHAVIGNPDLERARVQNYDLRWEWYPTIAENISVAVFYKHFDSPIEKTLLNATELTSSWQNAETAYSYGGEIEMRKGLGLIAPFLASFSLVGNLAVIESHVELDPSGVETTKERPLQGQSPYVLNLMLEYHNALSQTNITTMYNVFGRRIDEVGIAGTPDIYEEPFHKLDLKIDQAFFNKLHIKLTASNLLDPEMRYTQGENTQRHYKKGRSVSLGLTYSYAR